MFREYLGDGVYLTYDKNGPEDVTLTTGHHDQAQADNTVYMSFEMLRRAVRLIEEHERPEAAKVSQVATE
jgi:hypothetical protein